MKRIVRIFLAVFLLLPMPFASANAGDVNPNLVLDHVKVIQASERDGDELYFDIGVYQVNQPTQYIRIPEKPKHWPSQLMDKVMHVPLWSQALKPGQTVTLIVSLMESDGSLLNPDDLIGSMRVTLKNDNGTLQTRWSIPNRPGDLVASDIQKFDLQGEGKYEVYLGIKK